MNYVTLWSVDLRAKKVGHGGTGAGLFAPLTAPLLLYEP